MSITQWFQPPLYWQQFEDLTEGVFRSVYGDPRPTKFGRLGQADKGVDVYGRQGGNGRLIGIQCKRMDECDEHNNPRPGGKILKKHLDKESKEALRFQPQLDTWVLATTAKRDAKIQAYANTLDKNSRSNGSFGIQVWFWDDFVSDLNRYHDLQEWYYSQVIQIRTSADQDQIILELIREAFDRPAFQVPIHLETPSEFHDAIRDTQQAVNLGRLNDRITGQVIRTAIGGYSSVADKVIRVFLAEARKLLMEIRNEVEKEHKNSKTSGQQGRLQQWDSVATQKLTTLRNKALAAVNKALKQAGLPPV